MTIQPLLFSTCFNQITEGILIIDQEGNVEACNRAVETMFGYPEAELAQKPVYQFILPKNYHALCQKWISPWLERLSVRQQTKTFRVTAVRANHQQFPAVCSIASLKSDGYNGFSITIRDVSDKQLLETKQEELETRLRREKLMRHLTEVINESLDVHEILETTAREVGQFFKVDRVFLYRIFFHPVTNLFEDFVCIQYCANENIEPFTQMEINAEKAVYRNMPRADFKQYGNKNISKKMTNMPIDQRVDTLVALEGAIQSEEWQAVLLRAKNMAEKYNVASILDASAEYKGLPYGKIILLDSTPDRYWTDEEHSLVQFVADQLGGALAQSELYTREQKARQDAEIANQRKSEFLGMMSHELRTPLNSIIGFSDMTLKGLAGPLNERQATYLKNVSESGNHLLDIVNDLLDVAQIETGHLALHPFRFELMPLLESVRILMQAIADRRQVKLFFDIEPGLKTLNADPARFKQILINLLNNAIKFNRQQGSVFFRLYKSLDAQWLIGEIEDTGIGIPAEKQAELFNKFYQVDSRMARMHEGTGLGLALTKELVERHGGKISVKSVEGKGSTFTFKLPMQS